MKLLTRVDTAMLSCIAPVGEALAAITASEWLLAGVRQSVTLQVAILNKALVTSGALKELFACMDAAVRHQLPPGFEACATDVANM